MQKATLIFLIREGKVLLIKKKRGIGAGLYNGPGGRIDGDETPREGAVRELKEEVGLIAKEGDLFEAGLCHFFFGEKAFMDVWIFSAEKFSGEPVETEEASPVWFGLESVPFDEMWRDDLFWFPLMLEKRKFEGSFWFDDGGKILLEHSLKEI